MNTSEIVNALEAILTSLGSGLFSPLPVRRAVAEERALIARLKAEPKEKRLAGVEATLQREPVTGMYNILHRLPKDHDPCAGHPLRIEGYKELPDEVDVCVRIVEVP
jgi:hypothetical protein